MKKWLLILSSLLLFSNLIGQKLNEGKITEIDGLVEITVYKQPFIIYSLKNRVNSKIRKVVLGGETKYFFDINEGRTNCSIPYEDLQYLIDGIQALKTNSELDSKNNENDLKKMIMHPNGFTVGYYLENGKVKEFFSFGGINSLRDEDYGELLSFDENDTFFYEKDKYGTFIARLSDFNVFDDAFVSAKEKIEELMNK